LYQDSTIQIGFKSEYSQGQGRMMLFFGNGTSESLQSFTTTFSTQPSFTFNVQPVGNMVEPRAQLQQLVTMTCVSEFSESPTIEVKYIVGGIPTRLLLRLPLVVCKFMDPVKLNGGDFFSRWKQIEGTPLSEQIIVKSGTGTIDIPTVSKLLSGGFHFGILQGVDPNANNIVGAANFKSTAGEILCLLRIEANPQHAMYRVTVKTNSALVTAALKDLLNEQLGE